MQDRASITVITPASTYPVTLAEAKAHLRVDGTDEDSAITALIAAATDYIERYTGRSITTQTLRASFDGFADAMALPRGPVQSVASVTYLDTAGASQTVATDTYDTDLVSDTQWVLLAPGQSWPATYAGRNAVQITYTTGYTTCPPAVRHALLLLMGDWYRVRENSVLGQIVEMPHAVGALLANYRAFGF